MSCRWGGKDLGEVEMMDKSPNIAGRSDLVCAATTVPAELELLGPDMLWDSWARLWALTDLLLWV